MCLATVYIETDGEREEVMRDVAWIRPQGGEVQLITLMRESQVLQATIKSIDLLNSSVILERATTKLPQNGVQLKGESDG